MYSVNSFLFVDQLLLDLMTFREQALRLILDLSSTVITLLVSFKLLFFMMPNICYRCKLTLTLRKKEWLNQRRDYHRDEWKLLATGHPIHL
jgi:hypothetical protein